jgi:hypothetical protein
MPAQLLTSAAQYLRASLATCLRQLMNLRERYKAIAQCREARGITLLREWLSVDQRAQFDSSKSFVVVGCNTGKRYRISYGTGNNVHELDDADRPVMGWCFVPSAHLVAGDVMLAQKIALEMEENVALKIANRFPIQADRRNANVLRVGVRSI